MKTTGFSAETLKLDVEKEADRIADKIKTIVSKELKRQGLIVAMSGGIDSSTVAGLCVKTLGKKRVLGLLMPEKHSAGDTLELSRSAAAAFGIETIYENISPVLEALECYKKQDDSFKKVIPEYGEGWKAKIVLPSILDLDSNALRLFSVIVQTPDGEIIKKRLSHKAYLEIVAATNFKQRVRKMLEYYHADRLISGHP